MRPSSWNVSNVLGYNYSYLEHTDRVNYARNVYDGTLDRSYEYDQVGALVFAHSGAEARAAFGIDGQQFSPVQVGGDNNWVYVTAGNHSSLGIKKDGTLWAWGYNSVGELGTGNTTEYKRPVQVGKEKNWKAVQIMSYYDIPKGELTSCVGLRKDGSIWAWSSKTIWIK